MDIESLCREAWKFSSGHPDYDELIESYRDMLRTRAERVIEERTAPNGDGILERFERNVLELVVPERFHQPNPIPVEVKEELVEEAVEEAQPKPSKQKKPRRVATKKPAAKKEATKKAVKKTAQKGAKKR